MRGHVRRSGDGRWEARLLDREGAIYVGLFESIAEANDATVVAIRFASFRFQTYGNTRIKVVP